MLKEAAVQTCFKDFLRIQSSICSMQLQYSAADWTARTTLCAILQWKGCVLNAMQRICSDCLADDQFEHIWDCAWGQTGSMWATTFLLSTEVQTVERNCIATMSVAEQGDGSWQVHCGSMILSKDHGHPWTACSGYWRILKMWSDKLMELRSLSRRRWLHAKENM